VKRRLAAISFVLWVCICAASYSFLPDYLSAKMQKHLGKIFGTSIQITEIELADSIAINHQIFKLNHSDSIVGYSIITRALGCQIGGCDKPSTDSIAFEQFYFMTAFDAQKNIKKVRVLEYTSDHGYQIANKGWLKQFEKEQKFEVGKNIDGISGATISVKSITKEVNYQISLLSGY
jgi:hypothetical protein